MSETKEEMASRFVREIKERGQNLEDWIPYCFHGPAHERPENVKLCREELAWLRFRANLIEEYLEKAGEGAGEGIGDA